MKIIIKTGVVTGIDPLTSIKTRKPYLVGLNLPYSAIGFDTYFICRVSGTPTQISTIQADATITQLTDADALTEIRKKYSTAELYNCDIADSEVDKIAKSIGINPQLRADIKMSRGKNIPVLQEQENYLMAIISEKKGKTKAYWDAETTKTAKWKFGKDLEKDIIDGKQEAHEFVLSKLS